MVIDEGHGTILTEGWKNISEFAMLRFMKMIRIFFLTLAKFLTSAVFLAGACKNLLHWHETEQDLISVLAEWQSHFGFSQEAQIVFSYMISSGAILLILATFLLLSGGLLLLLGIRERLGLSLLILFLIPATLLFHPFWWVEGAAHETQVAMFLKNCAILGCLLQMLLLHAQTRPQETMAPFRF